MWPFSTIRALNEQCTKINDQNHRLLGVVNSLASEIEKNKRTIAHLEHLNNNSCGLFRNLVAEAKPTSNATVRRMANAAAAGLHLANGYISNKHLVSPRLAASIAQLDAVSERAA